MTISERSTEILRKFVFLTSLKRGKSRGKFVFVKTTVFDQTNKRDQIFIKTVFLLKMSHIQLNYAFLLFWSFFREIHWNVFFLVKKVIIYERSTEILRKFVFLNKFEKRQIQRKIWICLNNFLEQTSRRGQIFKKNSFSPQIELHRAKVWFCVLLKHFRANH